MRPRRASDAPAPRRDPGSLRDPAGEVCWDGDDVLRRVYADHVAAFRELAAQPFFQRLRQDGRLIAFDDAPAADAAGDLWLGTQGVDLWTYPGEWSAAQLADAALLTLDIQRAALQGGYTLKDATPHNVQFVGTTPVFTDILSFERHRDGEPWTAFRQFCAEFLGPLAVSRYVADSLRRDPALGADDRALPMWSRALPARTWLRPTLFASIHLHARLDGAKTGPPSRARRLSVRALDAVLVSLAKEVRRLRDRTRTSNWTRYYAECPSYSAAALADKKAAVAELIGSLGKPAHVVDVGCNTGVFSRLAAGLATRVTAIDADADAVDAMYRALRAEDHPNLGCFRVDLAWPTPSAGWMLAERRDVFARIKGDVTLFLATIHHLCLGSGLRMGDVAACVARIAPRAIVEWVPEDDPMVKRMAAPHRAHLDYSWAAFERTFLGVFRTVAVRPLRESGRILFLLQAREPS